MRSISAATLLFILLATAPRCPSQETTDLVIPMSKCAVKRDLSLYLDGGIFVKASRDMVLKGSLKVNEESFEIFLPHTKQGYSASPRPKLKSELIHYTSTYLAVDQNHDGKLESWESYLAELPLRLGDSMFDVVKIAQDGSCITLRPSKAPLQGAVVGRKVADFKFTTIEGKVISRDNLEGRALLIDCWAPS